MLTFSLDAMQYWAQRHLVYPIYFLTNVSTSTVDFVKSFLEWMSDSISKSFEHTRDNAFLLRYNDCHVMNMLASPLLLLAESHLYVVTFGLFCS